MRVISELMFSDYVLPFLTMGMLLSAAIVGAVTVVHSRAFMSTLWVRSKKKPLQPLWLKGPEISIAWQVRPWRMPLRMCPDTTTQQETTRASAAAGPSRQGRTRL